MESAWFPIGRLIAFDPTGGRLWAVCTACGRWSLAPAAERWEALEELEGLTTRNGLLLIETENVGLFRVGSIRVLRIGRTGLREESWWRYGRVLRGRRLRYTVAVGIGGGATAAAVGSLGLVLLTVGATAGIVPQVPRIPDFMRSVAEGGGRAVAALDRRVRFGRVALTGPFGCEACGAILHELPFAVTRRLVLQEDGSTKLRCRSCRQINTRSGYFFRGEPGKQLLRRVLAYHNYAGASSSELDRAVSRAAGRTAGLAAIQEIAPAGEVVSALRPTDRLALEMLLNEQSERAQLEGEIAALEARWREEEELARIIDDELTDWPELPRSAGGAESDA